MGEVIVRDSRIGDCEQILTLLKELQILEGEEDLLRTDVETLRRNGFGNDKKFHCFVAEDNTQTDKASTYIVGVLIYTWIYRVVENYTCMYIDNLVVREGHRGKGVGRKLMERAIEVSKEDGYGRLQLTTQVNHTDTVRFYEKFGGINVSQIKGWHTILFPQNSTYTKPTA